MGLTHILDCCFCFVIIDQETETKNFDPLVDFVIFLWRPVATFATPARYYHNFFHFREKCVYIYQ